MTPFVSAGSNTITAAAVAVVPINAGARTPDGRPSEVSPIEPALDVVSSTGGRLNTTIRTVYRVLGVSPVMMQLVPRPTSVQPRISSSDEPYWRYCTRYWSRIPF